MLENVPNCPVCGGTQFKNFLLCQDYTTSKETFGLCNCAQCNFVITNPRPDSKSLGMYYKSDSYISHTGSRKGLLNTLYLLVRKYTLQWKVNILKEYKPKGSLLDYGCGTGDFLNQSKAVGFNVTGVEPSDEARRKAETLIGSTILQDVSNITEKKFDIITLWHVLEHVADLKDKLSQLKNLMNENGIIFIAVPNRESYDATFYEKYWAGYDVPRHLWHFSKADMKALLTSLNLTLVEIKPMKLDSFYVSLLSEGYKHQAKKSIVNLVNGFLAGFKSNRLAKKNMNYSSLIYIARP